MLQTLKSLQITMYKESGLVKSVYPINDKVYHKIQFLDKTNGVFFE